MKLADSMKAVAIAAAFFLVMGGFGAAVAIPYYNTLIQLYK
jgi:hypothetical protein